MNARNNQYVFRLGTGTCSRRCAIPPLRWLCLLTGSVAASGLLAKETQPMPAISITHPSGPDTLSLASAHPPALTPFRRVNPQDLPTVPIAIASQCQSWARNTLEIAQAPRRLSPMRLTPLVGKNTVPRLDGKEPWIIDAEDHPPRRIDLKEYFVDDEQNDSQLQFSLVRVSNRPLIATAAIDATGVLTLSYTPDANGESEVTVRVSDGAGGAVDQVFRVSVLPTNDWPTTTGTRDVSVRSGQRQSEIDLFAIFDDVEDADNQLRYEVVKNTNPGLFQRVAIDPERGVLTLEYKPGVTGASRLTLRATDTGGKFVQTGSAEAGFPVYDVMLPRNRKDPDLRPSLHLNKINFLTYFALLRRVDGKYIFDEIHEPTLRATLRNPKFVKPGLPVVFDIELDHFNNTPEGRLRYARVLEITKEERPDLDHVGFYCNHFPRRNYFAPVQYWESVWELGYGPSPRHEKLLKERRPAYENWMAANAKARTEPLGGAYGNQTLTDLMTLTNISLYSFYRSGYKSSASGPSEIVLRGMDNTVYGSSLANGMKVKILQTVSQETAKGIQFGADYFVVNAGENSFQLASTPEGEALSFETTKDARHRVLVDRNRAAASYEHDVNAKHWMAFSAAMTSEALKNKDPVITWVSPSFYGTSKVYLDKNYFRLQLETVRRSGANGIAVFDLAGDFSGDAGWFKALSEFLTALRKPTEFQVTVVPE